MEGLHTITILCFIYFLIIIVIIFVCKVPLGVHKSFRSAASYI